MPEVTLKNLKDSSGLEASPPAAHNQKKGAEPSVPRLFW
jgi:hypothetical protein